MYLSFKLYIERTPIISPDIAKEKLIANLIAAWSNPDHNDGQGQFDRRTTGEDEASFPMLEKDKRAR